MPKSTLVIFSPLPFSTFIGNPTAVEQIHSTYLHEFERARRADEIRSKLVAGTRIKLGGA